ncbi:MAG: helix-turn-helix domain-containing protein [Candidatus Aenigmarchaeota archaeon]|nr:helix-turn-helix domain-containing protein [Candidatus Aenigmarchaeota archaeon]
MECNSSDFKERILLILDNGPFCISELSRSLDESNEFMSGYLRCMVDMNVLTERKVGKAKMFMRSAEVDFSLSKDKGHGNGTTIQNSVKRTADEYQDEPCEKK